jgi:hypothetical protein
MSDIGEEMIEGMKDLVGKMKRGEPVPATEVFCDNGQIVTRKVVLNAPRCYVAPIKILGDHPTAAHMQLAEVAGHRVVVGRHYDDGVQVVHIPVGAVLPKPLLQEMRLWNDAMDKGRLGGKRGDRVKARAVAGEQSDGLVYGSRFYDIQDGEKVYANSDLWDDDWIEGDDVTEDLGVVFRGEDG